MILILVGYLMVHYGNLWETKLEVRATQDNADPEDIGFYDNLVTFWIPIVTFFTISVAVLAASRKEGQQYGSD